MHSVYLLGKRNFLHDSVKSGSRVINDLQPQISKRRLRRTHGTASQK